MPWALLQAAQHLAGRVGKARAAETDIDFTDLDFTGLDFADLDFTDLDFTDLDFTKLGFYSGESFNHQRGSALLRKRRKKRTLLAVLAIACLLFAFAVIAQNVMAGTSLSFDQTIVRALRDPANASAPLGPAWLQEAARDLTSLGSMIVLVIMTYAVAIYLFLARKYAAAWLLLAAVFGGIALNDLLKHAFARPRPDHLYQATRVFTSSFPSAHAEISAITYLTMAALLAQSQSSFRIGLYFIVLAVLLTLLIGLSRIYLGVHYPTDVLGGWCIGAAWARACWVLMTWLQRRGLKVRSSRG